MKSPFLLACALFLTSAFAQAAGPIRVLYLGMDGTLSPRHCAALMRSFGRDAIWFDYASNWQDVNEERLKKYDAVIYAAPKIEFLLPPPAKVIKLLPSTNEAEWETEKSLAELKGQILQAAGAARQQEWQAFLTQREPEKREPNAFVANYEKRPEALTFQQPFNVKGSMERTQVPADCHLELFAAEPDIMKPIAFAWDARGRLWVAETRDYPHGVTDDGAGHDDIKICEDTDGDGKADKFTVFADNLNLPTSLTFARGGLIVAQPPRFLFLKDSNGDDKADQREVLIDGWGIRDTHAQASNLHYGFDNWIQGCVGYSGFKGTVGGKMHEFTMGTYRFRADGSAMEFLHQFSNNSWGQSQNAAGDDFGGTANNAPLFYGGIPAEVCPSGARFMTAKKINEEDKAHAITPNFRQVDVFGGYTAAAGSSFIDSSALPARFQGRAMVCEPTMKLISLMNVEATGAGYTAKDDFNLVASSDEWMSPVHAEVGPDGAVWFADWQNFIIQHNPTPSVERGGFKGTTGVGGAHENPLRDHARGRIYRIVWDGAPKRSIRPLADDTASLVAGLAADTLERRLTAQRLLVDEQKKDAAPALQKLVVANTGAPAAIHALWALQGLGALDEATHQAALRVKDPALRRNAIRALGTDAAAQKLFFGSGAITDLEPHTRLAAFVKLATFPTTPEVQTVAAAQFKDAPVRADEWLAEGARMLAKKHKAVSYQEGPNLLPNPGFEITGADGLPEGWKRRDYGKAPGNEKATWEVVKGQGQTHSGAQAVRCITRAEGDTSLYADVPLKPNTTYRLSGWIKTHALKGKASLNDHLGRKETERITEKDADWSEVEVVFQNGQATKASINILHVAKGDSLYDDVKLCEILGGLDQADDKAVTGDPTRGEQIFYKHPAAACILCHSLKGQGSTVGPALDGIATRAKPDYIKESLLEPNKVLAKGFEILGVSPMPPMALVLKPQELADIQAFLQTLK